MKKLILQLSLTLLTFSGIAQITTNKLTNYYPLNGNATDYAGNNNGIITSATSTTDRFGNTNDAYLFNGASSYIDFGNTTNIPKRATFSAWFNLTALSTTYSDVITKEGTFAFTINNAGKPTVFIGDGTNWSTALLGSTTIKTNQWYNLVATVDTINANQIVKIYVNGVLDLSTTITQKLGSSNFELSIGAKKDKTTNSWVNFFKGSIDDVRIYNKGLTQSEITSICNENVCFKTISVSDTLKITSNISTGLNDLPLNFGTVKVYPNPTSDILNISYDKPNPNYTINIFNSSAVNVYSTVLNQANTQLNISTYAKGIYVIKIQDLNSNVLETKKLVIQ